MFPITLLCLLLQTYRSPSRFLQLWFEAAAHAKLEGLYEAWGGLWTANTAQIFAANAVCMYTDTDEWPVWQQRGFELLQELYTQEDRLQVVKVMPGRHLVLM